MIKRSRSCEVIKLLEKKNVTYDLTVGRYDSFLGGVNRVQGIKIKLEETTVVNASCCPFCTVDCLLPCVDEILFKRGSSMQCGGNVVLGTQSGSVLLLRKQILLSSLVLLVLQ